MACWINFAGERLVVEALKFVKWLTPCLDIDFLSWSMAACAAAWDVWQCWIASGINVVVWAHQI